MAYLLSIVETVNSFQQIESGALLIVNNYVLGLIWGIYSIYLFDWHSIDGNGNLSSSCTAVFSQLDRYLSL